MLEYIGEEEWDYHNFIPEETIHLVPHTQYDAQIQAVNQQTIIVNGQPIVSEPEYMVVVFSSGSWIPYSNNRISAHWKEV